MRKITAPKFQDRLTWDRFSRMVILAIKQLRDPYYQGVAAQIAFYLLLSIVPTFLLLTELLKIFHISLESTVNWVLSYMGKDLSASIMDMLQASSSKTLNIVFIFTALWAASRAQFCIIRINNYTFSEGRTTGKGYFQERFRAVRTMAVTLFTVAFAMIILGYGDLILKWVLNILDLGQGIMEKYRHNIWMYLRWVVGFGLYFLMVSYNYYILPTKRVKFRQVLPGSLFASVGLLLVTLLYAEYTSNVANYDLLYGTLSSLVAVLFWLYFLAWVLCLGIFVNKVWFDTSDFGQKNGR